jgi:starch-binding outer membrane protein, SusD/RagB family
MRHIKNLFIATLLLLAFSGCKKFLDAKPDKQKIIPNRIEDLQSLLDFNFTMNLANSSLGEVSSDNYFISDTYFESIAPELRNAYLWDTSIYRGFPNDWSNTYSPVYYSNIVLENIERIPRTDKNENDWDNVKGSALLFRAKSFLTGVWTWAKAYDANTAPNDLGIPLRLTSDFNETSVRSNVKDCYSRIIEDLNTAVTLLPVTPLHVMRPSKPAAYALLARTYLSMREYDSCWKYADLCLQLKSSLQDFNSSSINASASYPISKFGEEVIMYSRIKNSSLNLSSASVLIDSNLYHSYNVNDLRKNIFFKNKGNGIYTFKGSYDGSATLFNGIATDEVYLMRAETFARKGNTTAALNDLNTLMSNRWQSTSFIPFSAGSPREALHIILEERRKELIFRDLRWMDVKRLNKEGANIVLRRIINSKTYELIPNDNRYALPLPQDVINISGMPQNPR